MALGSIVMPQSGIRRPFIKNKSVKITPCQFPTASNRARQSITLFGGLLLAVFALMPAAFAGQGAASYVDFDGATPGFGTPTDTSETALTWTTAAAGNLTTTAKPTTTQLTIGAVESDFTGVNRVA